MAAVHRVSVLALGQIPAPMLLVSALFGLVIGPLADRLGGSSHLDGRRPTARLTAAQSIKAAVSVVSGGARLWLLVDVGGGSAPGFPPFRKPTIFEPNRSVAALRGWSLRSAYRLVVVGIVCPSNCPTISRLSPLETRLDAYVCRLSYRRWSVIPAWRIIVLRNFFTSRNGSIHHVRPNLPCRKRGSPPRRAPVSS